ncbi:MAG: helix-turn-helix domain-containing protein [Arcobacter sp.]|nr:helix-turn-helix domain-containing protein [Arcobacter sp.]
MKNITNLTEKTVDELNNIIKFNEKFRARKRAEAILLSYKGKTVNEIIGILDLQKQAVWKWFRNFEKNGIESLHEKPGRGRKSPLRDLNIDEVKAIAINCPSVPIVNARIREKFNIKVSNETMRKFLKNLQIKLDSSKKSTTKET